MQAAAVRRSIIGRADAWQWRRTVEVRTLARFPLRVPRTPQAHCSGHRLDASLAAGKSPRVGPASGSDAVRVPDLRPEVWNCRAPKGAVAKLCEACAEFCIAREQVKPHLMVSGSLVIREDEGN